MNIRQIVLSLVVVLMVLTLTVTAVSQSRNQSSNIIVNGADSVSEISVTSSQDLVDSTAGVKERIVLQYANTLRPISLTSIPDTLGVALAQMPDRIVLQYANTLRSIELHAIPYTLGSVLMPTPDRIIFQYANNNRQIKLNYPLDLINDTSSPQVSDISAATTSNDSVIITWQTDEFADSEVAYGEQPGVYSQTVTDPLYTTDHEVTLTGLLEGTTYYYKVRSTDQSGNTFESSEYSFTLQSQMFVYLPLVLK